MWNNRIKKEGFCIQYDQAGVEFIRDKNRINLAGGKGDFRLGFAEEAGMKCFRFT
jgi:hypothetical protein